MRDPQDGARHRVPGAGRAAGAGAAAEGLRGRELATVAICLGIGYAALDEFHQAFVPSRTSSPRDVAVDGIGIVAGVASSMRRRPVGSVARPAQN